MNTDIRGHENQGATFVELFFDLVFVFAVTQVTSELAHHLTLRGVLTALVVFWLVWWAWTQFTWSLNEADTEHAFVRLLTLVATAVAFFMALTVPAVEEAAGWLFSTAYLVVRVIGIRLQWRLAAGDSEWSDAVRRWTVSSSIGLVAVTVSIFVAGDLRLWLLGLAALLDVVAAMRAGSGEWRLFVPHFAERHGLIVIIVLGESLIVAGAGAAEQVDGRTVALATAAVIITCAMWWTYFARAKDALEAGMERTPSSDRGRYARDVYSFGHLPLIAGVIGFAAGLELALGHPDEELGVAAIPLSIGVALFVAGAGLALHRAGARASPWRWITSVALVALAPVLSQLRPVPALVLAAAAVLAGTLADHRSGVPAV